MNYLVLSPGRSGSVMLARYLAQCLDKEYLHVDVFVSNAKDHVLHVHDVAVAQKFNEHQILLVRRSPVEIAASIMIAKATGIFHFKRDDGDLVNQTTKEEYIDRYKDQLFDFDMIEYLRLVQTYIDWYISAEDLIPRSIMFDYEEAIDISKINDKLNLSPNASTLSLPIAQPWDKWTKIKNGQAMRAAGEKLLLPYIKRHENIFA